MYDNNLCEFYEVDDTTVETVEMLPEKVAAVRNENELQHRTVLHLHNMNRPLPSLNLCVRFVCRFQHSKKRVKKAAETNLRFNITEL